MIFILFGLICFGASVVGAICGIGGGVIIKPVLDAFGILDVETISFLSGCTVLSMTTYSVIRSKCSKKSCIDQKIGFPLAMGASVGGIIGKWMFAVVANLSSNINRIGAVQAGCLLFVTVGALLYTVYKKRIVTMNVENAGVSSIIGLLLGIMSSFLGIGGGPVNLVVLFYFFSMDTKTAAENSLYIIFFSQITSLLLAFFTGRVPEFFIGVLILMAGGGILGGIVGRALNQKISEKMVEKLFIILMIVIIFINIFNFVKFMN